MIDKDQLAGAFALNLDLIRRQTTGLSHADSLLQPPFRANCLNWVLGHIAVGRNRALLALGCEPVLSEAEASRYETGSAPITGEGEGALALEKLLQVLEVGQERLEAGLQALSTEMLTTEVQVGSQSMPLAQRLFGLYFHDTYHTGQTELLRQLAGTHDKVV